MIFSVSAEPNKRLCGDSLLWGLLQYWFFIKVLSSKMKFSMIIQTCSWKHYEISFAWQHLLQQIFMHTLENSPVIILNQTIDLRVKKKWYPCQRAVQIIENFLFCFSLSIDSFLSNRKERKKENCNYSSAVHAVILTGLTGFPVLTPIVTGFYTQQ